MRKLGNFLLILLPILLLVAGSALADPKKAGPNHGAPKNVTECGTFLTEPGNYKLVNDLLDCSGDGGVWIVGSDITLNLKGHEISCLDGWVGIFVAGSEEDSVKNITVKNGYVSNCIEGIALWLAEDSKVMNMTSTGNQGAGIAVWVSSNNVIMHNHTFGNAIDGILSWKSSGNLFKHNTTTGNGNGGISMDQETDSRIVCNRSHSNAEGIMIYRGNSGNLLRGNLVTGNQHSGLGMLGYYWQDPEPPYDEAYYDMPTGNTIRSNIVGGNPWVDLFEAHWDGSDLLPNPDGICKNTWEKNQFQTEIGVAGCIGIPVELDDHDVCALDYDD
jgi:parallel beta-helix repeat protein